MVKMPHLEITKVVIVHSSIANNDYQKIQEYCLHLLLISRLVNC